MTPYAMYGVYKRKLLGMMIPVGKANISNIIYPDTMINQNFLGFFSGKLSQIKRFINYKMMNGMCSPKKEAKPLHGVTPPRSKYLHLLYYIAMLHIPIVMHVRRYKMQGKLPN